MNCECFESWGGRNKNHYTHLSWLGWCVLRGKVYFVVALNEEEMEKIMGIFLVAVVWFYTSKWYTLFKTYTPQCA